jgi:hypothetical protein
VYLDLQVRHHELAQSSTKALQEVEAQCESDLEAAAFKASAEYERLHVSYDLFQCKVGSGSRCHRYVTRSRSIVWQLSAIYSGPARGMRLWRPLL